MHDWRDGSYKSRTAADRPKGNRRLRERLAEDFASRLRQLHRAVDLGFPEFTRYVRTLESQLATTILSRYPTAASFHGASVKKLARIIYDGSHKVGEELARTLIEAAEKSVGSHHSEPYRLRIKYLCEDLDVLRRRVKDLARDIERKLDDHEVGKLLTTIDGVGPSTAACLIAELGDPARFRSAGAIASYVGVAPRLRQLGKKRFSGSPTIPFENARLPRRSGWWFSTASAATRGCVSTMNAFGPRAIWQQRGNKPPEEKFDDAATARAARSQ
jgi:transposase